MQAITAPISSNEPRANRADIVSNLQAVLLLLLSKKAIGNIGQNHAFFEDGLRKEEQQKVYGKFTQKLIISFQEQHQLETSGHVNEATAQAINSLLREHDALAKTLPLSLNMRGDAVKNLHEKLALLDKNLDLGLALPRGEVTDGIFGEGTRAALLQLQKKNDIRRSGIFDDATRNALDIATNSVADPSRIEGRIFLENGLPAAEIKLRIVNKGFGEDELRLGEIETDERGFYALPYDSKGAAVNLEVQALDASGAPHRLSNPKVKADRNEVLNLVVPSTIKSQTSEFKLMIADLEKVIGGGGLGKLKNAQEDEKRQDLSLLHQSTGWDARLIASAANAVKLSAETKIAENALYGALRAGLPEKPKALARVSLKAFETALTRANTAGVIVLGDGELDAAKQAFEKFALITRREEIVPGTLSSVNEMLKQAKITSDITPEKRKAFEELVLMHDGDDADLWTKAKAEGLTDKAIASLQLQGKLAFLTLNNARLTSDLQIEISSQDQLTQMVEKGLYRKEEWIKRIQKLTGDDPATKDAKLKELIPSAYTQEKMSERLDAYADDLARKVRHSFPTLVTSHMLAKNELNLGAQHAELREPAQMLLKNAASKGFLLGRTPVDQFLKQHGDSMFTGIDVDKQHLAEKGLKLLTRTYQMSPSDEAMKTLLALNFTSARQVVAIPRDDFVERYWANFGSRKITETVYDKSMQIASVTFNIYTLGKKAASTPPLMAIAGSPERHSAAKEKLKSLQVEYPTMEALFGSMDYCECEHCRSVLSPAAYLVDLLRFIDPPKTDWDQTLNHWKSTHNNKQYTDFNLLKPYEALIQRRPDLPHLPLTCENTNTALPYIDLVNEILEFFVANNELTPAAVRDTGTATSTELMAEPHNIVPDAYEKLKEARYPLTLPFDLWLETVRRFCNHFESPFWQVLETFQLSDALFAPAGNPKPYYRAQIYSEYLGLTPIEYALYTDDSFDDWPELYGYDDEASALEELKSAKTLSRRLGVSYKDLAELVQTEFVNPKLSSLIMLRELGLDVDDVYRYKKHKDYLPVTQEQKDDAAREDKEFKRRLQQATDKYKMSKPLFDAEKWLKKTWSDGKFKGILVLHDPNAGGNFDETKLCYADEADKNVDQLDYLKLNLFVRLWKRLGWTLEETDRALQTLLPTKGLTSKTELGAAFKTGLIYLAHLKELAGLLNLGKNGRLKLLTLWANLPTRGKNSLYAQLFLSRNILKDDAIFDDPLGEYLSSPNLFLKDHLLATQAALNLTADEIAEILQDANTGDESNINQAALSLANLSMLHRYGLLAKALKLSIAELIALKAMSGVNPFLPLTTNELTDSKDDYPAQTLKFVRYAQQVKASVFSISDLDYLFRHRFDQTGIYRENGAEQLMWMMPLATQLQTITSDYALPENKEGITEDKLRQKMALLFSPDVLERFMVFWLEKEATSKTQFESIFGAHSDGLFTFDDFIDPINQKPVRDNLNLLKKILPKLQEKLTNQLILQGLTAQTGGVLDVVTTLLTSNKFLALPDDTENSLLERFKCLGQRGLSSTLKPLDSSLKPVEITTKEVAIEETEHYQEASWQGCIQFPKDGKYRFHAKLGKKDATVQLRLEGLLEPVLNGKATQDNDEISNEIELKSGLNYPISIKADNLQDGTFSMLVKGETTTKDSLSQFALLPKAAIDVAGRAFTMLTKALQLVQGLGLNARDIRHILAHPEDFGVVGQNLLPNTDSPHDKNAVILFESFMKLTGYTALKRDLAGGSDDLIAIFERACLVTPVSVSELCRSIAELTHRKPAVVESTARQLEFSSPRDFANPARMLRLWQALQIVAKFGVSIESLKTWLTPNPNSKVAMSVRNAIQARYEPEAWQGLAKSIFDPLRQQQRDALVAHIMHIRADLVSVEKLFEYFLIDPGTEPMVQTSRLRLAISSLQTFIQRCFLNLEAQVHPSVLNAQHWAWMKRYRVWEANRKIFLFPENWLEPEWRDDKTHLYQELESSLLQGDVNKQLAEDVLYVYLKKLDQLARLEIVSMYSEEKPLGPPIMHVIGRTYTQPHQYFYRRFANQMWTAWEPVSADIEGEHIVAVMWRERLHLFWLTFMEKAEVSANGPNSSEEDTLGELSTSQFVKTVVNISKSAAHPVLDMQLNWSEYFQGAWSVRESSGFGNTIKLTEPFDPSKVFVSVSKDLNTETGTDGALWIHLNAMQTLGSSWLSFRVSSKNSRPELGFKPMSINSPYLGQDTKHYNRFKGKGSLSVTLVQKIVTADGKQESGPPAPQPILGLGSAYSVLPSSNQMQLHNAEFAPLISPLFYADDIHTFFVEPSLIETTVDKWEAYIIRDPRLFDPEFPHKVDPWPVDPRFPPELDPRPFDPRFPSINPMIPSENLKKRIKNNGIHPAATIDALALHTFLPNFDALTQPGNAVQFGAALVGSTGRLQNSSASTPISVGLNGDVKL